MSADQLTQTHWRSVAQLPSSSQPAVPAVSWGGARKGRTWVIGLLSSTLEAPAQQPRIIRTAATCANAGQQHGISTRKAFTCCGLQSCGLCTACNSSPLTATAVRHHRPVRAASLRHTLRCAPPPRNLRELSCTQEAALRPRSGCARPCRRNLTTRDLYRGPRQPCLRLAGWVQDQDTSLQPDTQAYSSKQTLISTPDTAS